MSIDFKVMNKTCDHILRGVSCFISDIDRKTLLPRFNPSQYLLSQPVLSGTSELKKFNPATRAWSRIDKNDSTYGWSIGDRPWIDGAPELGSSVQVQFKNRQQNIQQLWRLTYQVTAASCIKCQSSGTVSDLTLLGDPDLGLFVINEPKLAQDFLRMLLTPIGSNPYYTWLGTSLVDLPGNKFDVKSIESTLVTQISNAASALQNLQAQQLSIGSQAMTAREMIDSVSSITVNQSTTDSRVLFVTIDLYTKNQTLTTLTVPLST